MIRKILPILIVLLPYAAQAEVLDAETTRTFFTAKNQCKLSIPKTNFVIAREQLKADGTTVYYHLINGSVINLSFYLDTLAVECNNSKACTDAALKNPLYRKAQDIKRYEHAGFDVAELSLEMPINGRTIKQLNVIAEKYRNGCWTDIHISQVGETLPPSDQMLRLLETIKVE